MRQKKLIETELDTKYFGLIKFQENILLELIKSNRLNSSYVNDSSVKNDYLRLQIHNYYYVEEKLKKIFELLDESERIEKEFVLQSIKNILNCYLRELEDINLLEKDTLNLLQNEKDKAIINVIEQQRKAIARETYYLIKCYILISEKLESINNIVENNVTERKSFLASFEECKNKCEKILNIYKMQERLKTNNLNYNTLKVDKIIQEFLVISQEKLQLIKRNTDNINTQIQNLIKSINNLLVDRVYFDENDTIMSLKIANFLPFEIKQKENLVALNNNNSEIDTKVISEDKFWTESFFVSNDINISLVIENIKSLIEGELTKIASLQLSITDDNYTVITEKKDKYQELENLLKNKKWQEADQLTTKIVMEIINKESIIDVILEDLLSFPKNSLQSLDRLWIKHSSNQYGFSVQKRILTQYSDVASNYYGYKNTANRSF